MKLTLETEQLVAAVEWATKNYDARSDHSYVLMDARADGRVEFSHMNSNSFFRSNADAVFSDVEDGGESFTVDGKFLQQLAKALSSSRGQITLTEDKQKSSLRAVSSSGKFTIPLVQVRRYMKPKPVELGMVNDVEFFEALNRVSKLCDVKNAGAISQLASVDITFDEDAGQVQLFGTDRYALAMIHESFSPVAHEEGDVVAEILGKSLLLPAANASLVAPSKLSTTLTLLGERLSSGALRFGYQFSDGRTALFSLSSGNGFPDSAKSGMRARAEKELEHSVSVETRAMQTAIRSLTSLVWDEDDLFFEVSADELVLTDANRTNRIAVPLEESDYTEAEVQRIRFVRTVLAEGFSPVATPNVRLRWGGDAKAMVIEPLDEGQAVESIFIMVVAGN